MSTQQASVFASSDTGSNDSPYFVSHNPSGKTSILLIHGLTASGLDWDLVQPYLIDSYHLLLPDLPRHGRSEHIKPFSLELSSRLLADIIRDHAVGGRAHIIGHSLGAHVAIDLASSYPEVVYDVFISGFEVFPQASRSTLLPYGLWAQDQIMKLVPKALMRRFMDGGTPLSDESNSVKRNLEWYREMSVPMHEAQWPSAWAARTLIVAAGKGGIIPTNDHPHDAIKLMEIGKQRNPETLAVTHLAMRHPWNRQDPKLWAETARAWFEKDPLPAGFVRL